MNVSVIIRLTVALAVCYFSFVVLQQHFTEKKSWGDAVKKAAGHIGVGLLLVVASPAGVILLVIAAAFLVICVGEAL